MGVPKFFRYISERYPCLSEIIKEYQIPEFDNLYLDMNGIIHICSHPDDGDPHFRITEEKIFEDIFHYIEVLFRMIKPRKLFFMAVDGVAPRAKMNQQRGRRFRTAKEVLTLEAKARERGEVLPTEARFDSNCITPGTSFMAKLHEQLKYFVVNKISTDKMWQDCKVILSGHETPGEGEHKIMDYIRYMRAQPGYDPNTRHCLYGLDADLIMLGLCTHEPHFSLLREEVKFGKKSNKCRSIPEQINFYLLHLSLMREYLELEFYSLKKSLSFEYDMEKIIDDWVLMGFLVGNDFIPNLPNMHIMNGTLQVLYSTYMKVLPKLGGYINESGTLNLKRFEVFMQELANIDIENFSEKYADLKWFEGKTGRKFNDKCKPELRKLEAWEDDQNVETELLKPLEPTKNTELAALIKATNDLLLEPSDSKSPRDDDGADVGEHEIDSDVSENEDDLFNSEFLQHKIDYYMNKLEYESVTPEVLRSQAEEYVRAIQWNLHYYYNGICSWSWYYPHHYAPYISDIKGFADLKLNFELGKPFKPYEQLLAVLPAASKSLLPLPYQELMTDDNSPIKEYYPDNFRTDRNGKKQEWEAVVLIPFIDEEILLKAMEPCAGRLTEEEVLRSRHMPMLIYEYSKDNFGEYPASEYFPCVKNSHAKCESLAIEDVRVPREKLVKGAYPGVEFDVHYPGFPTMKHLKYEGSLEKCKVRVFEQPSQGESMVLHIIKPEEARSDDIVAQELLGKVVQVGWPYLVEALVVTVSTRQHRYHSAGSTGQYNVEENKDRMLSQWFSEKQGIVEHYHGRLGIDVGDTDVLVHVKPMVGRKYVFSQHGRITLEKQWANIVSAYPFQTIVRDISVYEDKYTAYKDVNSVFPLGSVCYMIGHPCYGSKAEVADSRESLKSGRLKLSLMKQDEPDLTTVMHLFNDVRVRYMGLHMAASKLAISKSLFSRITGFIYVTPGVNHANVPTEDMPKVNIGLNLKFNKKNEQVPGYTRKEGTTWCYSEKAVNLVGDYLKKFPDVFKRLNSHISDDVFFEEDIFPEGNGQECVKKIMTWMKQQPFHSIERQACGSTVLDPEAIEALEKVIDEYNAQNAKGKLIILQVKPHLLFKPELQLGNLMPDPGATFNLFDRIVNVREGYTVPVGLKGTIIGINRPGNLKENETTYHVFFDEPFLGGMNFNCSSNRVYRLSRAAVINISYGQRIFEQKTGKTTNAYPPRSIPHGPPAPPTFPGNMPPYYQPGFYPNAGGYQNWSQGCNATPQSMPNNVFNYPNFANPYALPMYNQQFPNPSGPNAFVPYKSNHFPNVPPQVHPGVPDGFQQKREFGKNQYHERKEDRNAGDGRQKANVQNRKAELNQNQLSSDMLKKMLNIDGSLKSTPKKTKPKPEVPKPVNDFFAALKEKQRQPDTQKPETSGVTNYTKRLQSECQTLGVGTPNYQHFEVNKKFTVKITLPNGYSVFGKPAGNKDQAIENAAAEILPYLLKMSEKQDGILPAKPPSEAVPEPPKRWQAGQQTRSNSSPQKSRPRSRGKVILTQEFRRSDLGKEQILRHLNVEPNVKNTNGSAKDRKQDSSQFVPMQVTRHRTRTISSNLSGSKDQKPKDGGTTSKTNDSSEKTQTPKSGNEVQTDTSASTKPRRKRKMRIAANFSSLNS